MAIPVGTTARQLETTARWMWAVVVVVAMLAWWMPSFLGWGALTVGLLAVLTLWVMQRIVSRDRWVPSQSFHWALLLPTAILCYHFVMDHVSPQPGQDVAGTGGLDLSLLFSLGLLATGVMLSQSLLPKAAGHVGVMAACGAAMMGGPALAIAFGSPPSAIRPMLSLVGLAGVCVWLAPLWGVGRVNDPPEAPHPLEHPVLRWLVVAVAATGAGLWVWALPTAAILGAGLAGGVLGLSTLVFGRYRWLVAPIGVGLLAVFGVFAGGLWPVEPYLVSRSTVLGSGGGAFANVSACDGGVRVLIGTVGAVGAAGLLVSLVWVTAADVLKAGRMRAGDQGRTLVWSCAMALATGALLTTGGLFSPVAMVAGMLVWGMAPRMLGRARRKRSGTVVLGLAAAAMLAIGMARSTGLVGWSTAALAGETHMDEWLHAVAGFLLALMMAWLFGHTHAVLGCVGILVALAIGGLGEAAQHLISSGRQLQWQDWLLHSAGCGVALVLYGLCVAVRWCESPQIQSVGPDSRLD